MHPPFPTGFAIRSASSSSTSCWRSYGTAASCLKVKKNFGTSDHAGDVMPSRNSPHSDDVNREKGLSKTPDVRLLLPIAVHDALGKLRVVNWIDSKAMFGDRHTHETENSMQVLPQSRFQCCKAGCSLLTIFVALLDPELCESLRSRHGDLLVWVCTVTQLRRRRAVVRRLTDHDRRARRIYPTLHSRRAFHCRLRLCHARTVDRDTF